MWSRIVYWLLRKEMELSGIMPDVTLTTASHSMRDIPESVYLDLSDGPRHVIGAAAAMDLHNLQNQRKTTPSPSNFHPYPWPAGADFFRGSSCYTGPWRVAI